MFYRIEVLRNYVFVLHGEGETILQEDDELDGAGRIDHPAQERVIIMQCLAAAEEKVVYEKASDFTLDVCCMHFSDNISHGFVKCVART